MAMQGYSYNTADGARVVYQTDGEDLKDVPPDGKTVGEIVVRGNLVMKEVQTFDNPYPFVLRLSHISLGSCSISQMTRLPIKHSRAVTSIAVTWL